MDVGQDVVADEFAWLANDLERATVATVEGKRTVERGGLVHGR